MKPKQEWFHPPGSHSGKVSARLEYVPGCVKGSSQKGSSHHGLGMVAPSGQSRPSLLFPGAHFVYCSNPPGLYLPLLFSLVPLCLCSQAAVVDPAWGASENCLDKTSTEGHRAGLGRSGKVCSRELSRTWKGTFLVSRGDQSK